MKSLGFLLGFLCFAFADVSWGRVSCSDVHALRGPASETLLPSFIRAYPQGSTEYQMRERIGKKGLTIVTSNAEDLRDQKVGPHPQIINRKNLQFFEKMFGAQIQVIGQRRPAEPRKIPGVVLHMGNSPWLREFYVGELNLTHVERGMRRYQRVYDNKWQEYLVARAIDAEVMPLTRNLTEIISRSRDFERGFQSLREEADRALAQVLKQPTEERLQRLEAHIENLVTVAFRLFRAEYASGAFVKFIHEAATGDHGSPIHTGMKEREIVEDFISRIRSVAPQLQPRLKTDSPKFIDLILGSQWGAADNTKVNLINSLLRRPSELIVQERLDIQKTSDNEMLEIRVNFVRGRAISGHNRWSVDHVPRQIAEALKFVNDFFDKAPADLRYMAGGADVVFLRNGKMKMIEFNFGAESGYMDVRGAPIEANVFMSNLIGRPTPLIAELESVHRQGFAGWREFFRTREIMKDNVKNEDQSVEDLVYVDSMLYFRDRALEDIARTGRWHEAATLPVELQQILNGERPRLHNRPDVIEKWEDVIESTKAYLRQQGLLVREGLRILQQESHKSRLVRERPVATRWSFVA